MPLHSFNCWDITQDGEGERGEHVETMCRSGRPQDAAVEAAKCFDDIEQEFTFDDHWSRVVEVETPNGPKRFRVIARKTITYEAIAI